MLRATARLALAAGLTFTTGFALGCTSGRGPSEIDKELAKAKKEATKRKSAECYPGSKEPCYADAQGTMGGEGTAGRGICKEGLRECDPQGFWLACQEAVLPGKELCNDIDDDCNGKVDDGFERNKTKCFAGEGECRSEGSVSCTPDGSASICSATPKSPANELCDGKDNDCNGHADDGNIPGTGVDCKTGEPGACANGHKLCVAGKLQCVSNHTRTVEICNKIDDDCDNKLDEDCISETEARAAGIIK